MPLLHFTTDDLRHNRTGRLSAAQQNRLHGQQKRALLLGAAGFWGLALLATGFLFGGQTTGALSLTLAGIFFTVLNALAMGMVARQWLRLAADLRGDSVECISGRLERIVRPGRGFQHYLLRVGGEDFAVTKEVFLAFQHEAPYHLYRTRHVRLFLSAEPHAAD
jgi:hypothetical protein